MLAGQASSRRGSGGASSIKEALVDAAYLPPFLMHIDRDPCDAEVAVVAVAVDRSWQGQDGAAGHVD